MLQQLLKPRVRALLHLGQALLVLLPGAGQLGEEVRLQAVHLAGGRSPVLVQVPLRSARVSPLGPGGPGRLEFQPRSASALTAGGRTHLQVADVGVLGLQQALQADGGRPVLAWAPVRAHRRRTRMSGEW